MITDGWSPPWTRPPLFGSLVVARPPGRVVVLVEVPTSADYRMVRDWLKAWLEAWLSNAPPARREATVSFMFLGMDQQPQSREGLGVVTGKPVSEFGYGGSPKAPDAWEEEPLYLMALRAMHAL